jgi:septum site-determining protein MinD
LFIQKDIDKTGKIVGEFQASGFIPKFIELLERKGYNIPRGLFSNEAPKQSIPQKNPEAQELKKASSSSGQRPNGARSTNKKVSKG